MFKDKQIFISTSVCGVLCVVLLVLVGLVCLLCSSMVTGCGGGGKGKPHVENRSLKHMPFHTSKLDR